MKRVYIITILVSILVLLFFGTVYSAWNGGSGADGVKVGFIYENDESTPYTYNFALAQSALEREFQDRVQILARSNVPENETEEPLRELIREGCEIIFVNNYSEQVKAIAPEFPDIQFCQGSFSSGGQGEAPDNYHTFNAQIYQGRYVSGIAAGMKLRDLIDSHTISADKALVGYVGAYPTSEVVSGYTAFLLGVRSVAPEATMRVRYPNAWSSYSREKACAQALIDEGCIVISQHTDTIGPAMACEEAAAEKMVFHVGYNQSMVDVAPTTSLISTRVNWVPYITGAVEAILEQKPIEKHVDGSVNGNDISAGFDLGWVQILELNKHIAVYGTEERLERAIEALQRGSLEVFRGDYIGVNPEDETDTYDLNQGYRENEKTSWPTFNYILKDVITVEG